MINTTIVNPKSFDSRYAHGGIAQVLFFESAETCAVSDAGRQGEYQGQQGIVPPTV